MTRKRSLLSLLILMVAICLTASIALAQDATPEVTAAGGGPLTYTVAAQGEITNASFAQTWTLQTASADRITIHVERTSGNLIPDVTLLDASSQQVTTGYNTDNTDASSDIASFTLPTGGSYQVVVQRSDGASGVTTGQYSILVTPEATADDNPNNTTPVGEVTADTPVSGEITGAHWYQRYTFNAAGSDVISVTAKRTGGTLFPQIEVLDANGSSLNTGYTNNAGDSAELDQLALPAPGTYTIAVTRANGFNGYTAGTYDLNVSVTGDGPDNPAMATSMGDVVYDTALTGDISSRWYEDWKLTTTAGDTLTITVNRTSGNLQPEVILLGGSSQELNHAYVNNTADGAVINRYQLDGAGSYTVRVSRSNGQNGVTTGAFSLMVSLAGAGDGSASLQGATGVVQDGTPANGEVTNARWIDTWTYTGKKGVVLDISAQRTDGTLIPHVEIRDTNGQTLTSGYPEASQDVANITGYALPSDGQYQIVVYRDNEQSGATTGKYTLTVKPTGS